MNLWLQHGSTNTDLKLKWYKWYKWFFYKCELIIKTNKIENILNIFFSNNIYSKRLTI